MSRFGYNSKAEDILVKAKVLLELIIADIQKNS